MKSISRFFRRSPSGEQPGEYRKAFTAAEKYQYHLKSNACWPASSDWEDCGERNSLPDSKVA
jgi:hypothetical protein